MVDYVKSETCQRLKIVVVFIKTVLSLCLLDHLEVCYTT